MKSISITLGLLFVLSANTCFSQLLRKDVYNFSVGDYFGVTYRTGTWSGDEQHTKDYMYHILSKQLSPSEDTVVYSAQRQIYLRPLPDGNGGTFPSSLTIDTFSFSYTNLNAPYHILDNDHTFGNQLGIYWQIDTSDCDTSSISTINSDLCPDLLSQKMQFTYSHMNTSQECADGEKGYFSIYEVYSHAGGPYGGRSHPQPFPLFSYDNYRLFFVAQNGVSCGSFPDYFLHVEEHDQRAFSVFPNPANDQLSIAGTGAIERIELVDLTNKTVLKSDNLTNKRIDISNLPAGVYLLRIDKGAGKYETHRIIKS